MVYNGKTLFLMDDFEGKPTIFGNIHFPPYPTGVEHLPGGGGKFRDSPLRPPSPYLGRPVVVWSRGIPGKNANANPRFMKTKAPTYWKFEKDVYIYI